MKLWPSIFKLQLAKNHFCFYATRGNCFYVNASLISIRNLLVSNSALNFGQNCFRVHIFHFQSVDQVILKTTWEGLITNTLKARYGKQAKRCDFKFFELKNKI